MRTTLLASATAAVLAATATLASNHALSAPAGPALISAVSRAAAEPAPALEKVQFRRGGYGRGGFGRGFGRGAGIGAAIVGGAVIGRALAGPGYYGYGGYGGYGNVPYYNSYYAPAPVYAVPPPTVIYDNGDADAYCFSRFRSYDPRTRTYLGYDGFRHPCP